MGSTTATIILAGGRGSRLGGVHKPSLRLGTRTLLEIACDAVPTVDAAVVVGEGTMASRGIRVVREEPKWGGPVAALAAGLEALASTPSDDVLVLAADLVAADAAVAMLAQSATAVPAGVDGVIAVDGGGRRQPLLARYRRGPLLRALELSARRGSLADASMRSLLSGMTLQVVRLPDALCADVDVPEDVHRFGIEAPAEQSAAQSTPVVPA